MLKILFITDTYVGGNAGSERHLYQLVKNLNKQKFSCQIIQLTTKKNIPYISGNLDGESHINIRTLPVRTIYWPISLVKIIRIIALLQREKYHVIQSIHEKADLINILIPRMICRHIKISSRRDMGFKKSALLFFLFKLFNWRFDKIIAPTGAILKFLSEREGVKIEKTLVIPNGVDLDKFTAKDDASTYLARRHMSLSDSAVVIGCVANLKIVKGHAYLIDAFKILESEFSDLRMVFIGGGELLDELMELCRVKQLREKIQFLGQRDDVPVLLKGFDILVSASLSEGLSNSMIEAASVGLPIVATDVGGNSDIVCDNVTGYLVEPRNSLQLYEKLKNLVINKQLRITMGEKARTLAVEKFTLDGVMSQYDKLYTSAA